MGKDKKPKKGKPEEDFGKEEVDEPEPKSIGDCDEETAAGIKAAGKKGKKTRRKKDDDWEDDVAKELEALTLEDNLQSKGWKGDSDDEEPTKADVGKGPRVKKRWQKGTENGSGDEAELDTSGKAAKKQAGGKPRGGEAGEDAEAVRGKKGKRGKEMSANDLENELGSTDSKPARRHRGKKGKGDTSDSGNEGDAKEIVRKPVDIKPSRKLKGKKGKGDVSDSDEREAEPKPSKKQKNKKGIPKDGSDEELAETVVKTKGGRKAKEDVVGLKSKKTVGSGGDAVQISTSKLPRTSMNQKSMFQLLDVEDLDLDTDEGSDADKESDADVEENHRKTSADSGTRLDRVPTTSLKKEGKKSKKKDRRKDDEDEVEKAMEELAMEIEGKKSKKKDKRKDDEDEVEKAMEELAVEIEGKKSKKDKRKDDEDEVEKAMEELAVEIEGKKSKKKDRRKDDEDEVDKAMEELAMEIEGKKSKKKDRRKDDEDEAEKASEELATEIDGKKPQETQADAVTWEVDGEDQVKEVEKSKKKKKKKKESEGIDKVDEDEGGPAPEGTDESTVKTAAQKRKEKKDKDKQKKLAQNAQVRAKKGQEQFPELADSMTDLQASKQELVREVSEEKAAAEDEADDDDDKKKKKKKKKPGDDDDKKDKKRPGKKQIAAMQEALKKLKEEEERQKQEEELKRRAAEEAERLRQEKLQLEQERKEKKKQKEKERRERLKAEGKLLSRTQKQARARMEATLQALRQQGVEVPLVGEKKERAPRLGDRRKPAKKKPDDQEQQQEEPQDNGSTIVTETPVVKVEIVEQSPEKLDDVPEPEKEEIKESWEDDEPDVKEAWDESTSSDEGEEEVTNHSISPALPSLKAAKKVQLPEEEEESGSEDESESGEEEETTEDEESESEESSEESEEDEKKQESLREKVLIRLQKQREEAEKKRTTDKLRSPVICVLGHVDTGKTKILDKIRHTHVQDGEAGGITQQIGATMVPKDAINEQCKMVKSFTDLELKVPGLLIIDTPGHESFSNLRTRGSSLCDMAILVVDIMHGLEPQTIESINLLKQKKTPFVVALNKIDRLYDWKPNKSRDVQEVIKSQQRNTKMEFEERTREAVIQFAEQSLNATLFYENKDPRTYISMVPTSAATGDGMGNLIALIVELSQSMMARRIAFSEELQATVLEVKAIPGLGTTVDVILVNGRLREGDTMVVAGHEGPVVTQIRSLLMPQPLKELRVKSPYMEFKEVEGAQGVKIAGKDLDKAIAGLQVLVAQHHDEIDVLKEEVACALKDTISAIKLAERGVYVQASTLGSLEALLEFLRKSKIPYSGIRIGPVVKKDVMKASIMLEHDSQYAAILAFDVKVERDAQELADSLGVKIFQADIIYHLFDKFMAYRDELKRKKREEFKGIAVFPCKLRILPHFIFNSRDPIVVGVSIEAGVVKEGTPLCIPSRDFLEIGTITTLEMNHKSVEVARKGQEVCIKVEPSGGEAPKMYGRHFDHTDVLVSKISRQSIDACKEYFRDDLQKTDWQLMVELKKLQQVL